jgi:hypothetical protein
VPSFSEQGINLILDPELVVAPSPLADYVPTSEAESESQAPRKKRKTRHISADKALVIESMWQLEQDVAQAGPSFSTSRATRHKKEINYARVKRKYTKLKKQ